MGVRLRLGARNGDGPVSAGGWLHAMTHALESETTRLREQVCALEAETIQLQCENSRLRDEQQSWWRQTHQEAQP